jgi:GDP-4-dehydro-6-deoxy-D-mannose reductase
VRLLVTGAGGFVASHLAELLRAEHPDVEAVGLVRPHGSAPRGGAGFATLLEADLNDPAAMDDVLDRGPVDRIVHLAGQSSVHVSWIDPGGTLRTNVLGLVHLLDAVRRRGGKPDVLVVGSAEEYGAVDEKDLPLREDRPLLPASPYAVSKVAQSCLAAQIGAASGMRVVRTRTFHHTGPGRGETFAESSFARQIAECEAGLRPPVLHVGNLGAVRDYTDVRDVVRAYWALVERGEAGAVYNVCSGHGRSIRELLDILIAVSGARLEVKVETDRLRRADVPAQIGDPTRLRQATGWEPRIPLEQTLRDLLNDWRRRLAAPAVAARNA